MNIPETLTEWMTNASDDTLSRIVRGGIPQQLAIITLAKQEQERRA
jgi:hypothetical protein